MSSTARLLSAAAGFVAGFAVLWLAWPGPDGEADAATAVGSPRTAAAPLAVDLAAPSPERAEPEPEIEAAPAAAPAIAAVAGGELAAPSDRADGEDAALAAVVWGRVTYPDGTPSAGAYVSTPAPSGDRIASRADTQGRYALGPLDPGEWTVSAGELHCETDQATLTVEAGDASLRRDFVLVPQQRIHVFLVDAAGEPTLPQVPARDRRQAVPVATSEHPGATFDGVRGSLNNTFGIGHFWQTGYKTTSRGPGHIGAVTIEGGDAGWISYVVDGQVLASERFDRGTESVTFTIGPELFGDQAGAVRGRVIDPETGEGVAAEVTVSEHDFAMGGLTPVEADGSFELADVRPGPRYLIVKAPERAELVRPINLAARQVLDLGDVELPLAVSIRGTVVGPGGEPTVAVIECGRLDPAGGGVEWPANRIYQSDADGRFAIASLVPGRYIVRSPGLAVLGPFQADDRVVAKPVLVDATVAPAEGVELVLEASTGVVLVTAVEAEPWPRAEVRDSQGLPVVTRSLGRYGAETAVRLAPGDYRLVVTVDGEVTEDRPLEIGAEPLRVEL